MSQDANMLITCVLVRGTTCENCVRVINTRTVQQARHCAKHQDVHSMLRHTHDTNDRTVSRTNKLPRNASSGAQMHAVLTDTPVRWQAHLSMHK